MKKVKMGVVLVLALLAGGTALAGEVRITGMQGKEAFIASRQGIQRIQQGTPCEAGDMLVTRQDTQIEILLDGRVGCRLLPGTTLAVGRMEESRSSLVVAEGNVVFNVKKMKEGSQFMVDTPTAVAAVRGTQFWGRVAGADGDMVSTFAVRDGVVNILQKATGQSIDLKPGQAVDLGPAGALQARAATPDEMAAMRIADEIAGRM